MSVEAKGGQEAPLIIQKAAEVKKRGERARELCDEAKELIRTDSNAQITRPFTKPAPILKTTIADNSGWEVEVTISPKNWGEPNYYSSNLDEAAIEIEVGDYDTLLLPPHGKNFGKRGRFAIPDDKRLTQYEELLKAIKEKLQLKYFEE